MNTLRKKKSPELLWIANSHARVLSHPTNCVSVGVGKSPLHSAQFPVGYHPQSTLGCGRRNVPQRTHVNPLKHTLKTRRWSKMRPNNLFWRTMDARPTVSMATSVLKCSPANQNTGNVHFLSVPPASARAIWWVSSGTLMVIWAMRSPSSESGTVICSTRMVNSLWETEPFISVATEKKIHSGKNKLLENIASYIMFWERGWSERRTFIKLLRRWWTLVSIF